MPRQHHFHGLNQLDDLTASRVPRARRWSDKKRLEKLNYMRHPAERDGEALPGGEAGRQAVVELTVGAVAAASLSHPRVA